MPLEERIRKGLNSSIPDHDNIYGLLEEALEEIKRLQGLAHLCDIRACQEKSQRRASEDRLEAEIKQLRGVLASAHGIVYAKAKANFHAEYVLEQIDKVLAATANKEASDE